jgi:hypothetical protein
MLESWLMPYCMQGNLGNCYIVAAMSAVAHYNMDILKNCFMGVEEYVAGKRIGGAGRDYLTKEVSQL